MTGRLFLLFLFVCYIGIAALIGSLAIIHWMM